MGQLIDGMPERPVLTPDTCLTPVNADPNQSAIEIRFLLVFTSTPTSAKKHRLLIFGFLPPVLYSPPMQEGSPDHVGETIDVIIQKVTDPLFLEFAETLRGQMQQALRARPDDAATIRQEYRAKINKLIDWWEINIVRWTVT